MELNATTGVMAYVVTSAIITGFIIAAVAESFLPPKTRCPFCYHLSRKKQCPRCGL